MYASQLQRILTKDPVVRRQFGGVLAADQLPTRIRNRPKVFIINTDKSTDPGSHWVAFYFPERGPVEFFDSCGRCPDHYQKSFKKVLLKNGRYYKYNRVKIQDETSVTCGHFCLFYAYHRCYGWSWRWIINVFDKQRLDKNDQIATSFVDHLLNC